MPTTKNHTDSVLNGNSQKKPNMTSASSIYEKKYKKIAINGSVTEFNDVASAGVCECGRVRVSSHQYQ